VQHLNVTVQATPGFPQSLPDEYEVNLYRIAQELLQNTLKHAEATEAMLQLDCFDNTLLMRYSDNGKGFDFAQIQQKNGNGIANLHARVQLLNGTLQINTAPQQGMNVAIQIPYKSTLK
jgi:signal transduction histidine kinase